MTTHVREILQHNLRSVYSEIDAACGRVNRSPAAVRLVAVTKYAESAWITELSYLHQTFGENRPQQLADRQQLLPDIEWHLIGQLQRNKVKLALQHTSLIHSVDSLSLLEKIAETASALGIQPSVLLQVNVSGEESKSGFSPLSLARLWPEILAFSGVVGIKGLMTMAPESEDPETARPVFRMLRLLRDELADRVDSRESQVHISELSMGMSGDFIPAVEEGATLIRIGSRIFAGLSN